MRKVRTIGRIAAVSLAFTLFAIAPAGAASEASQARPGAADAAKRTSGVTIGVTDYTTDGKYISTTVINIPAATSGSSLLGNETIPPPAAPSGCRSAWTEVWDGTLWEWHRIRNTTSYCYNQSTLKVTQASSWWTIQNTDGISLINQLTEDKGYYTYHGSVVNSGYKSLRVFSATREVEGLPTTWYYRADVYVHGDGSSYHSWLTV